jgi:hypothetical protein
MMEALRSSETSVLTRATWRNISEDAILHSHCRENLKSCIALTGWTLYWRSNVSPVKNQLGFYIPEDDILHSHCRENLKSYIALTDWTRYWRSNVSPVKYQLGFYIPEDDILQSHCRENLKSYIIYIISWAMFPESTFTQPPKGQSYFHNERFPQQ